MSALGRWTGPDPRAEKYRSHSPCSYSLNRPLYFTDPGGDTVQVYTRTLNAEQLGGGLRGKILSAFGLRHAFMRVTTGEMDVHIELGGPQGGRTGQPVKEKWTPQNREEQQEHDVQRPKGVSEQDYSFENQIIDTYNAAIATDGEGNQDHLPAYVPLGSNSNGFINFLIDEADGEANLPIRAIGKDEIDSYRQMYRVRASEKDNKKQ